jgi:hypothetical protein
MEVLFSDVFVKSLRKHGSFIMEIHKKADMIIKNPIALGEPLKGNLRGYCSSPVKKNFLIIYLYCRACRAKADDKIVLCKDCRPCGDETLKFVDIGPHDKAFKKKSYWS